MNNWATYLRQGLRRTLARDPLNRDAANSATRSGLRNLRPFLARHWRKAVLGTLLILLITVLGLISPLVTRYLVDQVILARRLDLLLGALVVLAGLKGAVLLGTSLQQFYFARFEQHVILDVQTTLFGRVLRFPKTFFDENEVGYLMARLSSDVQELHWFFSATIVTVAVSVLRLVTGLGFLFYLRWQLALVAILAIPALVLVVRYFSGRLRALGQASMERRAQVSRDMQESLSTATLIKAFAAEDRAVGRMQAGWQAALDLSLEQLSVGMMANLSFNVVPGLAGAVVLALGAYWVIRGQWTLGSLLAFQAYLGFVFNPAQFLASSNLDLQRALVALQRVSTLFDIVPEEQLGSGRSVERLSGRVELLDVSFAYSGRDPVLEHVSVVVRPGESVAIVGPSGVGKTTLISLLLCFYKPTGGEIYFDALPVSAYELASLRRRIGYVPQSMQLLSGTIFDNLRYGEPGAEQARVVRAARLAGIHDFIMSLPGCYDAMVGERGVNLSEGQKQRLAIARALVKDPDILIFDEPTSALDSVSERSIFDALPAAVRGKTLFVVAHRLVTVQNADRILVLNEKRLLAAGTHSELLRTDDYYRSLVANQQILAVA